MIRCLVEVSWGPTPAGTVCSVTNSGPDKIFNGDPLEVTVTSPGGGILIDDTALYAGGAKKEFKFKEKWQCTPPLISDQKVSVVTKGVADRGADDYPLPDDDDDNPSNNTKTRFHILKK